MKFVDCFMLMGTALSLRGDQGLPAMDRPILQDLFITNVNVSITLNDIFLRNSNNMELEFSFLLHQRWVDPRLDANQQTKKFAVNGQIWRPWITATQGEIRIKDMTQFWRGFGSAGNILYSENVIIKTFCTRNFKKYPFDTQKCLIKLGSYRFPLEEVQLSWDIKPTEILTIDNLIEFKLLNVITYSEIETRPSGNFSILVMEISIQRYYEHYIFCTFIPCTFIIFMSYFVFWLKPNIMYVRYGISCINLSLLLYIYHSSVCLTVSVPYMKALDIFVSICYVFVAIVFFENLIIDLIFRLKKIENKHRYADKTETNYNNRYKFIDYSMRVIYPVLFLSIIFFYFIIFV